jgi:hypothetical protein
VRRVLALVLLVLAAPAYAAQDWSVCLPADAGSMGTVEAVREVPVPKDLHAFDAELLEHKIRRDTAEQLVVRLDSGPVLIFPPGAPQRLQAGERVRVMLDGGVEREAAYCAIAPLARLAQRGF